MFMAANLTTETYTKNFTRWHYRLDAGAGNAIADPELFFFTFTDMLTAGDMLTVSGPDGASIYVVTTRGLKLLAAAS